MVGSHGVRGCTTRGQLRSWSSGAHPGPPGPAPVAPHTSHDPSARLTLRVRRETNAIRFCCDSQRRLPRRGAAAACGHGTTRQRQRLGVAAGGGGRRCGRAGAAGTTRCSRGRCQCLGTGCRHTLRGPIWGLVCARLAEIIEPLPWLQLLPRVAVHTCDAAFQRQVCIYAVRCAAIFPVQPWLNKSSKDHNFE